MAAAMVSVRVMVAAGMSIPVVVVAAPEVGARGQGAGEKRIDGLAGVPGDAADHFHAGLGQRRRRSRRK